MTETINTRLMRPRRAHVSTMRGGTRNPRKRTATQSPVVGWPRTIPLLAANRQETWRRLYVR